jgi:hypothetical protein
LVLLEEATATAPAAVVYVRDSPFAAVDTALSFTPVNALPAASRTTRRGMSPPCCAVKVTDTIVPVAGTAGEKELSQKVMPPPT